MIQILQGHCLDRLRELPDESVQCCVTSPPYWGLRDYGIPPVQWERMTFLPMPGLQVPYGVQPMSAVHGLEPDLMSYIAHEVAIFREVRRVLKADGVCWVNLGDGYASTPPGCGKDGVSRSSTLHGQISEAYRETLRNGCGQKRDTSKGPVPPKNLLGIPWRVAFALQADGWFLRQDVIWHKPNPMPESVTDRCTKAHEYLFIFSKGPKYYWDQVAVREKNGTEATLDEFLQAKETTWPSAGLTDYSGALKKTRPSLTHPNGPNLRSVWSIVHEAYPEAHFATFPSLLPKRCILASTRSGDTVLDPFAGSGTTGMVALDLGRRAILIEANPDYVKLILERTNVTRGLAL